MKQFLIAIACCVHGFLFAQYEAANWYFGENAGLNFNANTGEVTPLLNGNLNTKEGSSSISDQNGNLLFYTDGITVYNKNHSVMENGSNLYGNPSSTQSAIVIPKPNSSEIFYIFTVGSSASNSINNGFNYSIVDMTQNSGLGKVTQKNINLLPYSSEKASAVVKDCNTQSIWAITLSTNSGTAGTNGTILPFNTYYAYEITETEVNTIPVRSTFTTSISDPRGALKLSPDGSKMVSANMDSGLLLYDFDVNTGIVSNQRQLTINSLTNNRPYGAEFSSNNKYLYIHASNDYNGPDSNNSNRHYSSLIQYDLNAADISFSQVVLDDRNLFRGALQLGPDGKIYRALAATYDKGLPYLGVIENPNAKGTAARYRHNAIDLSGNNSTQGLPPFIQSFFNQKIDIIHASNGIATNSLALCTGDSYILEAQNVVGATYDWTFNGSPISTNLDPWKLKVTTAGYYKVLITPPSSTICDVKEGEAYVSYYDIPVANTISSIQSICDIDNDGVETIDLTIKNTEILGSQNTSLYQVSYFKNKTDADTHQNVISSPASYVTSSTNDTIFAKVYNFNNPDCFDTTSFVINLQPAPTLIVQDIIQCDVSVPFNDDLTIFNLNQSITTSSNGTITFYESDPFNTPAPTAIPNPTAYSNSIPNQTIYVRAENTTGCEIDRSFSLISNNAPITTESVYFCTGSNVTLELDSSLTTSGNNTYQWFQNNTAISGETSEQLTINTANTYQVAVKSQITNCVEIFSYIVEESGLAVIDTQKTKVSYADGNNTVTVSATGLSNYQYALFSTNDAETSEIIYRGYQNSPTFTNVYPGIYNVKVQDIKNNCGIAESTVYVVGFTKFFTPNGDGYNDTFKVEGATDIFMENSKVLIFNRYGKLIKELALNSLSWDGTFNGVHLPNDDYWFTATLQDGRTYKSHFTLKR